MACGVVRETESRELAEIRMMLANHRNSAGSNPQSHHALALEAGRAARIAERVTATHERALIVMNKKTNRLNKKGMLPELHSWACVITESDFYEGVPR